MSYSFKEICKFERGQTYWESSQYGSIRFTVKDAPIVSNDGEHEQVRFKGVTDDGEEISFLVTEGLEHYGPSFYDFKAYVTSDEIREEVEKFHANR